MPTSLTEAQLGAEVPEVDLHGQTVAEALYELDVFIDRHLNDGVVRIICGKGTERLASGIKDYLRSDNRVLRVETSQRSGEMGAVFYAEIQNNR